jgi:hypothetical protein
LFDGASDQGFGLTINETRGADLKRIVPARGASSDWEANTPLPACQTEQKAKRMVTAPFVWDGFMRNLCALPFVLVLYTTSPLASPDVSADDAQAMRAEALADRTPERIHGRFDFMLEDPEAAVDRTSGSGGSPDDDCANVPIRLKRSDGITITKRANVCD